MEEGQQLKGEEKDEWIRVRIWELQAVVARRSRERGARTKSMAAGDDVGVEKLVAVEFREGGR